MTAHWIASARGPADTDAGENGVIAMPYGEDDPDFMYHVLDHADEAYERFYEGYANQVLWPTLHGFPEKAVYDPDWWDDYYEINERFAEKIDELAGDGPVIVSNAGPATFSYDAAGDIAVQEVNGGLSRAIQDALRQENDLADTVFINDYHHLPLPRLTDVDRLFLHIPWPAPDEFRQIPEADELFDGLSRVDTFGVHTDTYRDNVLDTAEALGYRVDWEECAFQDRDGNKTRVTAIPVGIDYEQVVNTETDGAVFREEHGVDHLIVGVDRLDYTKGLWQKALAVGTLLADHPEYVEDLVLSQKYSNSRDGIAAYDAEEVRIQGVVDHVNAEFGTDDWQPLMYHEDNLPIPELFSRFAAADVILSSPVKDGLNLVALESVTVNANSEYDGILALGEQAGAHELVGEHAVTLHPERIAEPGVEPEGYDTFDQYVEDAFDEDSRDAIQDFADALYEALQMPEEEKEQRMDAMDGIIRENRIDHWIREFLER